MRRGAAHGKGRHSSLRLARPAHIEVVGVSGRTARARPFGARVEIVRRAAWSGLMTHQPEKIEEEVAMNHEPASGRPERRSFSVDHVRHVVGEQHTLGNRQRYGCRPDLGRVEPHAPGNTRVEPKRRGAARARRAHRPCERGMAARAGQAEVGQWPLLASEAWFTQPRPAPDDPAHVEGEPAFRTAMRRQVPQRVIASRAHHVPVRESEVGSDRLARGSEYTARSPSPPEP